MSAGPSVFGDRESGERTRERLGLRASARKEELLYSGIGKFRCETKEGKDRAAGGGKDIDDEHGETGRSASGMRLRLR